MATDIALYHHEKCNADGYRYGLRGEQILQSGRIVALADVYDALRHERVYKQAFSHKRAVSIITNDNKRTEPSDSVPEVLVVFK